MDTDDVKLGERLARIEARLAVLEGWRVSLKNDLDNAAQHTIEVDSKCREIQEYLDERKATRAKQATLVHDIKKWLAILILGWVLMAFLDGAKIGIVEWLKKPVFGQHER